MRSGRAVCLLLSAALSALSGFAAPSFAAGCDLDEVIGYQMAASRTIEGYIDYGLHQKSGFVGCEPGRILAFTDRSGVRCKQAAGLNHLELPKAWLFARTKDDMKLCVGDELYDVGPLR